MRGRIETRGRSVAARVIGDLPLHPVVDTQAVAERLGVGRYVSGFRHGIEATGWGRQNAQAGTPFDHSNCGHPAQPYSAVRQQLFAHPG